MASPFAEKLQVALVTATLVSAGGIVAGAFVLDRAETAEIEQEIASKQTPGVGSLGEASGAQSGAAADRETASTPPETQTATLMIPVINVAAVDLVDTFSDERSAGTQLHEALDIPAPAGTSVVASAPGKIERLFRSTAAGNTVYVRSEDGETIYYYAHLEDYAPGLNEGQQVRRGQRLGTVGSTGNAESDAPHLHFEVMRTTPTAEWWEPAISVNPYPLLVRQAQ